MILGRDEIFSIEEDMNDETIEDEDVGEETYVENLGDVPTEEDDSDTPPREV
jgi:hypothetical protein